MRSSRQVSRRRLLRRGLGGLAGAVAAPYVLTSGALGSATRPAPGDRLALGFIGVGGMGRGHLGWFLKRPEVEVLAVADVYGQSRDAAIEMVREARDGTTCDAYRDYRELLARRDIDAVLIATPDHWHAMTAIHACEAGKDVYCEKPLSLTVREARRMVEAARRCGTVFQTGSQQRSSENFRQACEWVLSGRIGRLERVRAFIGGGPTCGFDPVVEPPDDLDWNFWLGPAPWADYTPKRCHYTFRWIYDYSGGKMTDWGAHHNDIAQWGIGASLSGPIRTEPVFAEFPTEGLFDTATRFEVKHTYANGVELYTCSHGPNGVHFQGSDGWIKVGRGWLESSDPDVRNEPLAAGEVHLYDSPGHHEDWMNCIRSRRRPICDVEIGCRSVTVCHLGTIAIRTGRKIEWDPNEERIVNDPGLERWLDKPYRGPWQV